MNKVKQKHEYDSFERAYFIHASKATKDKMIYFCSCSRRMESTPPPVAEISTIGNQDAKINPYTPIPTRGSSPLVPQTSPSRLSRVRAS